MEWTLPMLELIPLVDIANIQPDDKGGVFSSSKVPPLRRSDSPPQEHLLDPFRSWNLHNLRLPILARPAHLSPANPTS